MDQDWLENTLTSLAILKAEIAECSDRMALHALAARLLFVAEEAEQRALLLPADVKDFIMPNASERVQ